jgi:hypothetical protein
MNLPYMNGVLVVAWCGCAGSGIFRVNLLTHRHVFGLAVSFFLIQRPCLPSRSFRPRCENL